jgi:hypothetical protein
LASSSYSDWRSDRLEVGDSSRQSQARINLVPRRDRNRPKTIQDMLRWVDPSILLKVYAHSRMDKRMEAQAKMIEAMGLNDQTVRHLM